MISTTKNSIFIHQLDDAFLEIKKDGVRKSKATKKASINDKNEWFTV